MRGQAFFENCLCHRSAPDKRIGQQGHQGDPAVARYRGLRNLNRTFHFRVYECAASPM